MSQTTSLTPAMLKIGLDSKSLNKSNDIEKLRHLIEDALKKQMHETAAFFAERLLRLPDIQISDEVLFARCYFNTGEYRRCLAVLEHRGLLSTDILCELGQILHPTSTTTTNNGSNTNEISNYHSILDRIEAILLAAKCLVATEQIEDCIALLEYITYLDTDVIANQVVDRIRAMMKRNHNSRTEINPLAAIYGIMGRCLESQENRQRSVRALFISVRIDMLYTETVEYAMSQCLLSREQRNMWYDEILEQSSSTSVSGSRTTTTAGVRGNEDDLDLNNSGGGSMNKSFKLWIVPYYRFVLDIATSQHKSASVNNNNSNIINNNNNNNNYNNNNNIDVDYNETDDELHVMNDSRSVSALVRRAERLYEQSRSEEAYSLARQAYTMDPFYKRGLLIYIGSMADVGLKTELYYLGHELVSSYPKQAISWYAVGCYYWCCSSTSQSVSVKLDLAIKYFQKAVKLDKRFAQSWMALGHVMAAQEESEHAISAYRNASRLSPGDYRPLLYMGKELIRTGNIALALHVLQNAHDIHPTDPCVLNELGIVNLKQKKIEEALMYFQMAAKSLSIDINFNGNSKSRSQPQQQQQQRRSASHKFSVEILSNLGVCLRTTGHLEEAKRCFEKCLAIDHADSMTHAHLGFTLHLLQRFEEAIAAYHRALSLGDGKGNSTATGKNSNDAKHPGRAVGAAGPGSESVCVELLSRALSDWEKQCQGQTQGHVQGGVKSAISGGAVRNIYDRRDINDLPFNSFEDERTSVSTQEDREHHHHSYVNHTKPSASSSSSASNCPSYTPPMSMSWIQSSESPPRSDGIFSLSEDSIQMSNEKSSFQQRRSESSSCQALPWLHDSGDIPRPLNTRSWRGDTSGGSGPGPGQSMLYGSSSRMAGGEYASGDAATMLGISAVMSLASSSPMSFSDSPNPSPRPSTIPFDNSMSDDSYSRVAGRLSMDSVTDDYIP